MGDPEPCYGAGRYLDVLLRERISTWGWPCGKRAKPALRRWNSKRPCASSLPMPWRGIISARLRLRAEERYRELVRCCSQTMSWGELLLLPAEGLMYKTG